MAGVEIAGFVLSGFPLLISAAEHYEEGFEPLVKWKRFRTEFIHFIDAIDIEKQLFMNTIERFLIEADIPQDEVRAFMTTSDYAGWRTHATIFQSRLGATYPAYISTINKMKGLMEELKGILALKDGNVDWAKDGESRWNYQMKRVQLSFSKKGTKTLSALETHNRKLRELLDSNSEMHQTRQRSRKDTAWGSIFGCIRHYASNLHTALQSSWCCDCTLSHIAALRLQKRGTGSGWTSKFYVDFSVPTKSRREVVISVKEKEMSAKQASPLPSPESDEYLLQLRTDFESKSFTHLNMTSPSSLRSGSTNLSSSSSFKDLFSVRYGSSSRTTSSSSVTQTLFSKSTKKPKKVVDFDATINVEAQVVVPKPLVSEPVAEIKIENLCSTLCSNEDVPCLGYILDEQQRQYELRPLKNNRRPTPTDSLELINLETLLKSVGTPKLSRQERYKIASILASSLLQLQSTPWLAENLNKRNIFFFKDAPKVLVEQPFINHSFISTKIITTKLISTKLISTKLISPRDESSISPAAKRSAVRRSLNQLGIILLELCFGQTIEDQDLRKDHLRPDGKAHKETDYLTAIDWSELVMGEEPELEPIINSCLFCTFQEKADWDNTQFVEAVYLSVVEPLEKLIGKFSQ